jgi:hypothetical protein
MGRRECCRPTGKRAITPAFALGRNHGIASNHLRKFEGWPAAALQPGLWAHKMLCFHIPTWRQFGGFAVGLPACGGEDSLLKKFSNSCFI